MNKLQDILCGPLMIAREYVPSLLDTVRAEMSETRAVVETPEVQVSLYDDRECAYTPGEDDKPRENSLIAVVSISGVVTRFGYGGWYSSAPGTQEIGRQLQRLDANSAVYGIVLAVNTPGGSVVGTPELADIIYSIREKGRTKIVAAVDSLCCSAGAYIASASTKVYAIPSAILGSIGVIYQYADYSAYLEKMGIKYDIIRTPSLKARFSGVEPMDESMRELATARNEELYGEFVAAMAKFRGVKESHVKKHFGGGETLTTQEAIDAGLIDGTGGVDDVLASMVADMNKETSAMRRRAEEEAAHNRKLEAEASRAKAKAELDALLASENEDESEVAA